MSKYQIACKPGHRASEHLFVVKSVLSYYKEKKKGMIASGYDFKNSLILRKFQVVWILYIKEGIEASHTYFYLKQIKL